MHLHTPRLLLRDFVPDDWRAVQGYQSHPDYLRFYPNEAPTEEESQAFVARFLAAQGEEPRRTFQLAITLPESGTPIGNVGVRVRSEWEADIGYELDPAHWGQGYATEAARVMVAFAFSTLRLHRLWARCLADNVASARVLAKLGMVQEGRLREKEWFKGRWWDELLFGMLESEWKDLRF